MARADARREFGLEAPRHGAGRHPPGTQAAADLGDLFLADRGLCEVDEIRLVMIRHRFLA
jgi:hypothetical protein